MSNPIFPTHAARFRAVFATWSARRQERIQLAALTHRELRDIGLSPGEAMAESAKPFWLA
jgi:uncharacterized protein YjiS (DUF1127 family)